MPLAGTPDLALAIRMPNREGRMRLDIALMDSRRFELLLNNDIGFLERCIHIAE